MRTLDRRSFLAAGALALAAPSLAGAAQQRGAAARRRRANASRAEAARRQGAEPAGGLKVGAQSYTFRQFDLEQALARMKKCGLKYAEFYSKHCPQTARPEAIKAFLSKCKEYDVTPLAWGVQRFTKDHDANKKVFDFGKALGIKMFSADPTADAFDSLDKLCAEYKIAIGIHPHGPVGKGQMHPWWSAEIILKAVKDRHELIGACLDTGHLIRCAQLDKKLDVPQQIRLMGKRNFGLHLKDHDNKTHTDVVIGKGSLDVPAVVKALREVKFAGLISIEYEANPKEPTKDVQACVEVFQAAAKK